MPSSLPRSGRPIRQREVEYQDSAAADLEEIYLYLVSRGANAERARNYVRRIRSCCRQIAGAAEGGGRRDDLAPGLRTWAFERRVLIAYRVERDRIVVEHLFYGGRDVAALYARGRAHGEEQD